MESMNEHKKQIFQDHLHQKSWGLFANSYQESIEEASTISNESSSTSVSSCSSFDTADDASSLASSSSSSLVSNGSSDSSPLDLSDLMIQLPIKRGLSKFYHGKSESFTSLSRVMSIEDLPKKMKNPYNKMKKMKANSKSYGGGLDNFKSHTLPKPIILKKNSSFLRLRSFARSTLVNTTTNNGI